MTKQSGGTRKRRGGEVDDLVIRNGLLGCVQCGKCSSACTMVDIFPDFDYAWAPRTIVQRALLGEQLASARSIWYCLTCDVCEATCPSGVRFRDFIRSLREFAAKEGRVRHARRCKRCGTLFMPEHTLEYIEERIGKYKEGIPLLCERCKRYMLAGEFKRNIRSSKKVDTKCRRSGKKNSRG
jgi:Fe-S oxidoreductase